MVYDVNHQCQNYHYNIYNFLQSEERCFLLIVLGTVFSVIAEYKDKQCQHTRRQTPARCPHNLVASIVERDDACKGFTMLLPIRIALQHLAGLLILS